MKSIGVLMFGLVMCAPGITFLANAQELTKEAKIERLLVLMKVDAMMDQMYNQMMNMAQAPSGATPEQRAKQKEIQGKILDILKGNMAKMRPEYVKIYGETFSDEEINGMLAFYNSPAGRAMIEKTPILMPKIMAVVQARMAAVTPEIQRLIKEAAQK